MAGIIKRSTGLTGLAVSKNPHHVLTSLYNKTLRTLAKMPASAVYRTATEEIISKRLAVVTKNTSVPDVERLIGCGQVEELIVQAENELLLSRKMLGWKPWEPLMKPAPVRQWQWPPAQLKGLPQN